MLLMKKLLSIYHIFKDLEEHERELNEVGTFCFIYGFLGYFVHPF